MTIKIIEADFDNVSVKFDSEGKTISLLENNQTIKIKAHDLDDFIELLKNNDLI